MARDYLAIQAGSASTERLFSASAVICTVDRSSLKSDTIEMLVVTQDLLKAEKPLPANWMDVQKLLECLVYKGKASGA